MSTSTPRVGSSNKRRRGSVANQRASTTFCWLPPERVATAWAGDVSLTFRALAFSAPKILSRFRLIIPPGPKNRDKLGKEMFSVTLNGRNSPSPRRSSVTKPVISLSFAGAIRSSAPVPSVRKNNSPESIGSRPTNARASSVRPEPSSPHNPTISPS